jgi:Zn-dependent protease
LQYPKIAYARTLRKKPGDVDSFAAAYRCCHNVGMSGEIPWVPPSPPSPSSADHGLPPAPPASSYPSHTHLQQQDAFGEQRSSLRKRLGGALAGVLALLAKFGAALKGLLVALPNLKLLTTAGTALVSVAAYSLWFGWTFAIGFVVLLFVHEMGHVIALRREGIKASAPMFIPFMGAVITSKSLGENALAEARVGLAGPILGTVGSVVCLAIGELTNSDLFRALAYIGFFLNLFNLLPVVPLDGGRAMAAMAPSMWFLGFGALIVLAILEPGNPILLIIILFAGYQSWHRWQQRRTRTLEQAAYYRVSPRNRLIVGAVYIGLIVALVFGMHEAHILATGEHSFGSI